MWAAFQQWRWRFLQTDLSLVRDQERQIGCSLPSGSAAQRVVAVAAVPETTSAAPAPQPPANHQRP